MNAPHVLFDAIVVALVIWPGIVYGRTLSARGLRLSGAVQWSAARGLVGLALVFVFANIFLLSVRNYPAISWYLPLMLDYYCVPGLWALNVVVLTFAFTAVVALGFLSHHPARWLLPIACVGVFAVMEYRFRTSPLVLAPEVHLEQLSPDGVVLQTSGATCGAAACANAARILGMNRSEREMAALLGTTEAGTSPAQIVYAMRGLGFTCTKRFARDIAVITPPAILFVKVGPEVDGHVVTFAGMKNGQAEIWDPSNGKLMLTVEDLQNRWGGRAIEIARAKTH